MKGAKPDLGNVIPMKGDAGDPVPDPLDFMTELGKEVWGDLAPELARMGRLKIHFRHQFASYCEACANFIRATNEIELHGVWYETKTRNGTQQKKSAAWTTQQESMNQMRRDSALFGLSPVDEARIGAGGQGDLFDELMAQLKGGPSASA